MKPRTILLLTCAVAAVVAPGFMAISCGPHADNDDEPDRKSAAQTQAFAAASVSRASDGQPPAGANATANSAAAPATPKPKSIVIPGLIPLPPMPEDFPRAARAKAARREFLSSPGRWSPQKAAELQPKLALYHERRFKWDLYPLRDRLREPPGPSRMWTQSEADAFLVAPRRDVDAAMADRSQLTKDAAKEWAAWDASGWRDYPLRQLSSPDAVTPGDAARLNFRAACMRDMGPLLDEIDYLYDRDYIARTNVRTALDAKDVEGSRDEARRLLYIMREEGERHQFYVDKFEAAMRIAQGEWEEWEGKNWEGFPVDGSFVTPGENLIEATRRRAEKEGSTGK